MTESNIKDFRKVDKIEELGGKICKLVRYYEQEKGRVLELVALVDILFSAREIFRSYNERFKELEERLKNKERMEMIK